MEILFDRAGESSVGIVPKETAIGSIDDAMDAIGAMWGVPGCRKLVIYKESLDKSFFSLSTGFAGEMLQKYTNYRFCVAIVGDISEETARSRSLHDFVFECNKGRQVLFCETLDTALERLESL